MIKTYEDWENSLDKNYVNQLSPDAWDPTCEAFEAGQQSQQAKIDELQAKAQMCRDEKTHAISRWSALCKERDELQGRIDRAIGSLKLVNHALLYEHLDHIINLLDGTTNEQ